MKADARIDAANPAPPHPPAKRRRMWHSDWLIARDLRSAVATMVTDQVDAGQSVVDFGCGAQPYRDIFETSGARYAAADLDADAELPIDANGRVPLPDASADRIVSFQVLEHVRDLGNYLGEARRLLKPDGRLILSTHGSWLYHPHPEDHRRWTREGLVADLAVHGFTTDSVVSITGPLAWTTIIRLTSFAYVLRKVPLVGGLLAGALGVVMNARAWAEDQVTPKWVRDDNACVYLVVARPS